jgi:hypothetical protein
MSTLIMRRKWNWIGRTLRKGHEAIEREEEMMRGRPRHTWRRTVHNEAIEKVKSWSEVKRMAGNRTRWRCFVDALFPLRDKRNWWWWSSSYLYNQQDYNVFASRVCIHYIYFALLRGLSYIQFLDATLEMRIENCCACASCSLLSFPYALCNKNARRAKDATRDPLCLVPVGSVTKYDASVMCLLVQR